MDFFFFFFLFFFGGGVKTFLVGSVDHIIYRDYIVNRRSFIYCSLDTTQDNCLRRVPREARVISLTSGIPRQYEEAASWRFAKMSRETAPESKA